MSIPYVLPDHLSVSQLRTFMGCGLRWGYGRVADKVEEVDIGWDSRLRGSALDDAATAHFKTKAVNGEGLSLNEFVDTAMAVHLEGEDTHMFGIPEVTSRDRLAAACKVYHSTFGRMFQPISADHVQLTSELVVPGLPVPVVGIMDLVTTFPMVVDTKLKRRAPTQRDVDRDFQLTTYAAMMDVTHVALAVIVDEGRKGPQPLLIQSTRSREAVESVGERYRWMWRMVSEGILMPPQEEAWFCTSKWCAAYGICPHGEAAHPPLGDD